MLSWGCHCQLQTVKLGRGSQPGERPGDSLVKEWGPGYALLSGLHFRRRNHGGVLFGPKAI